MGIKIIGARSKEHGRAKVARGGRAKFLVWHGWEFVRLFFCDFFLCGNVFGDGSLAKRVA